MKQWLSRWWPAVLMMMLIFIASGTSGQNLPRFGLWDTVVKKGGHMTGYALLAAALMHGLAGGRAASHRHTLLAVFLAALYAATDEFHQSFTPGRSPAFTDVAIDALGAVMGVLFWSRFRKVPVRPSGPEAQILRQ